MFVWSGRGTKSHVSLEERASSSSFIAATQPGCLEADEKLCGSCVVSKAWTNGEGSKVVTYEWCLGLKTPVLALVIIGWRLVEDLEGSVGRSDGRETTKVASVIAGEATVSSGETPVAVGSEDNCCIKSLTRLVVQGTQDDIEAAIGSDGEVCRFAVEIVVTAGSLKDEVIGDVGSHEEDVLENGKLISLNRAWRVM